MLFTRVSNFYKSVRPFIFLTYNRANQNLLYTTIMDERYLEEGKARLLVTSDNVFYNPVQEFNRDLSILVLRVFIEEFKKYRDIKQRKSSLSDKDDQNKISILEALSASGLRSIRYAKEIPGIDLILANDISAKAVESIEANIKLNEVEHIINTSHEDATLLMYKNRQHAKRFVALDLDPYGCPSIFLDGAVQCIQDGGLMLVTATDMAVLAGNSPETCYSKYGAISLKSKACHEQALRILLQCIESHANRYGRYIVPMLSISADFYIRVFVRIFSGPVHCKKTTSKLSMVYQCTGCESFSLQLLGSHKPNPSLNDPARVKACLPQAPSVDSRCEHCSHKFHMGGPIWSSGLHDMEFVEKMLKIIQNEPEKFGTSKRIEGVLCMVLEELNDVPLYYSTDKLCSKLHLETIPMLTMRSAIINGGYRVSYSHACKSSLKTDAPAQYVWDILRHWEKLHPVKKERLVEGSPATIILSKAAMSDVNLKERECANPLSRKNGYLRFQDNPTPFWGPGMKSSSRSGEEKMSKSKRNQNRKSNPKGGELKQLKRERSEDIENDSKHIKITPVNG